MTALVAQMTNALPVKMPTRAHVTHAKDCTDLLRIAAVLGMAITTILVLLTHLLMTALVAQMTSALPVKMSTRAHATHAKDCTG